MGQPPFCLPGIWKASPRNLLDVSFFELREDSHRVLHPQINDATIAAVPLSDVVAFGASQVRKGNTVKGVFIYKTIDRPLCPRIGWMYETWNPSIEFSWCFIVFSWCSQSYPIHSCGNLCQAGWRCETSTWLVLRCHSGRTLLVVLETREDSQGWRTWPLQIIHYLPGYIQNYSHLSISGHSK